MTDLLLDLANRPATAWLIRALGLPAPVPLARADGPFAAQPLAQRRVLLAAAPGGYATSALRAALEAAGAQVEPVQAGAAPSDGRIDVLVCDATGLHAAGGLQALYEIFHPLARAIARNARVLIAAAPPARARSVAAAACARGVEGFMRSLAKELGRRGAHANLLYLDPDAVDRLEGCVRYLCTVHSTYVSGQCLAVTAAVRAPRRLRYSAVLRERVAVVTGAARGIGAAVAQRLGAEGARVLCVDLARAQHALAGTAQACGGAAFALDVADPQAPQQLMQHVLPRYGGIDVLVHNAGITRDKTLANMSAQQWAQVCAVNFEAIVRLDAALLERDVLRDDGRIVCLSSINGIAGSAGQCNYATTKAALIGYVAARGAELATRGICVNAVAPGFIETQMTAAMPWPARELGRRMSSLRQGGLPHDVAELVAFLASPGACGVTGSTVRVCGQNWIGA